MFTLCIAAVPHFILRLFNYTFLKLQLNLSDEGEFGIDSDTQLLFSTDATTNEQGH